MVSGEQLRQFGIYEPAWSSLQTARDENPFMHAAVGLLSTAASATRTVATALHSGPLKRDDAIRGGLLVRAYKHAHDLLDDTCNGSGRHQLALSRPLLETLANLLYLDSDETGELHSRYVNDALIAERELLNVIRRRLQEPDAHEWNIEERMTRSLQATAAAAGVDLATMPGRRANGWPGAEERITTTLGDRAYVSFRTSSDPLHGGWNDLLRNHLTYDGETFTLNFDTIIARPQPLLAAAIMLQQVVLDYLLRHGDQHQQTLVVPLAAALGYTRRADDLHEEWLTERAAAPAQLATGTAADTED